MLRSNDDYLGCFKLPVYCLCQDWLIGSRSYCNAPANSKKKEYPKPRPFFPYQIVMSRSVTVK